MVFAGFSAPSLRDRINDAQSAVVVCADIGVRGGKKILIKDICDEAVQEVRPGLVQSVVVFKHYSKPGMEGKWVITMMGGGQPGRRISDTLELVSDVFFSFSVACICSAFHVRTRQEMLMVSS